MENNNGFKSLIVYRKAYQLALEVFHLSKKFPPEEKYALTDQIRRASRSICANIGEGYRKRIYPKHFTTKMSDADGECSETVIWLNFAKDCGYLIESEFERLEIGYEEIGRMLGAMIENPEKFFQKIKSVSASMHRKNLHRYILPTATAYCDYLKTLRNTWQILAAEQKKL